MNKLIWDDGFKRKYKKLTTSNKILQNEIEEKLNYFVENSFDPRLKTHKLMGKFYGFWAFSINYQYRIVFEFLEDSNIFLIDIGTHDEVY